MRLLGLLLAGVGSFFVWSVLTGQSPLPALQDLGSPQLLLADVTNVFTHSHPPGSPAAAASASDANYNTGGYSTPQVA